MTREQAIITVFLNEGYVYKFKNNYIRFDKMPNKSKITVTTTNNWRYADLFISQEVAKKRFNKLTLKDQEQYKDYNLEHIMYRNIASAMQEQKYTDLYNYVMEKEKDIEIYMSLDYVEVETL